MPRRAAIITAPMEADYAHVRIMQSLAGPHKLLGIRHTPLDPQLLEDLDTITTWVLSEHPGERPAWVEGAQRLRDAAELDKEAP